MAAAVRTARGSCRWWKRGRENDIGRLLKENKWIREASVLRLHGIVQAKGQSARRGAEKRRDKMCFVCNVLPNPQ